MDDQEIKLSITLMKAEGLIRTDVGNVIEELIKG